MGYFVVDETKTLIDDAVILFMIINLRNWIEWSICFKEPYALASDYRHHDQMDNLFLYSK